MKLFSGLLLASVAAGTLASSQVIAAVPPVDAKGLYAITVCPKTLTAPTVYYSDKIVFKIIGPLPAVATADQQALDALPRNALFDIKVRDNPKQVANLEAKVLSFLGAVANVDTAQNIQIISVQYTGVVCPAASPTPGA